MSNGYWPFPKGRPVNTTQDTYKLDANKLVSGQLPKPTLYLLVEDDGICISAFSAASEEWEANHIKVQEVSGRKHYSPAARNILTNILQQAGITYIQE